MSSIAVRPARRFVCSFCVRTLRQQRRRYATSPAQAPEQYDVVCVGGGPAGLSLLTALKSNPKTSSLKLALIESQDLSNASQWSLPADQYSNRCSSLTPSSASFLSSIGAWEHLDTTRVQPYTRMQVWDGISGQQISFDWAPHASQSPTIAYMNENANLVRGLLLRLEQLGGCDLLSNTKVSSITLGSEKVSFDNPEPPEAADAPQLSSWPHLTLSSGRVIAARLLVGADGANSPVRTFAGIESRGWDYGRHGVVATLRLSSRPSSPVTAYQRFLPTGPVAMLPMPGNYASLVWSTTPENAAHLKNLATEDFVAMVNSAFRLSPVDIKHMHTMASGQGDELSWRLDHTPRLQDGHEVPYLVDQIQEGSVASFPLRMRHADTYATHRVALVGDAAHTIHPLAGQGLNMGLGDIKSLAGCVEYAVEHGMDVGDQLSLERYSSERYTENHVLLGVVDKLHKLYSYQSWPVVGLRSLGLGAVDKLTPLKELFMGRAEGRV